MKLLIDLLVYTTYYGIKLICFFVKLIFNAFVLLGEVVVACVYSLYERRKGVKRIESRDVIQESNELISLEQVMFDVDTMDGKAFEHFIAELLKYIGFRNVSTTPASGDYGVDIIAYKDSDTYVFQCKRYESKLGLSPIQEIYAGKQHYKANKCVVVTNSHFTQNAKQLAEDTDVILWDREYLKMLIGIKYK